MKERIKELIEGGVRETIAPLDVCKEMSNMKAEDEEAFLSSYSHAMKEIRYDDSDITLRMFLDKVAWVNIGCELGIAPPDNELSAERQAIADEYNRWKEERDKECQKN